MRIVVDTNVVISGVFFGGAPRRVVEAIIDGEVEASASPEIVEEYGEIVEEMISRKQGRFRSDDFSVFVASLDVIEPTTNVVLCRDPDDDKFISCAIDSGALYIVSGDKDLLVIGHYAGVDIVTASDFCAQYFPGK